jgi:DNA repair photolyase
MQYELIQAKTLLSKIRYGDGWFHDNRSMNPYRGCEHACIYCDGFCQYYRIDNFFTHIRIKENAPTVLRQELERMKYQSQSKLQSNTLVRYLSDDAAQQILDQGKRKLIIGISGGVSDSYQPAEEQYRISRQVLETLLDFRLPVFLLTKSNLMLRDMDLLKEIHKNAFVNVCFSITLIDEETKAIFEPKSSATWERFEALKEVRKAGMFGGVFTTPTIPGVGDTIDNMQQLAKEAKRVGAEFIMFSGMTLKPGRQKEHFFKILQKRMPKLSPLLQSIYANNHTYGHPIFERLPVNVMIQGHKICKEIGISDRSVRHMMPDEPEPNVRILNRLFDLVFYRSIALGKPKPSWQSYQDLAIKIEKGVGNLAELRQQGLLTEQLAIGSKMERVIEEILDMGSCQALNQTLEELNILGEKIPN